MQLYLCYFAIVFVLIGKSVESGTISIISGLKYPLPRLLNDTHSNTPTRASKGAHDPDDDPSPQHQLVLVQLMVVNGVGGGPIEKATQPTL